MDMYIHVVCMILNYWSITMFDSISAIFAFITALFNKSTTMVEKSTDIPLDAVIVVASHSNLWKEETLLENGMSLEQLKARKLAVEKYMKTPEYKNSRDKDAKKYVEDKFKNS